MRGAWKWRRRLRAWEEEMLEERRLLLLTVVLWINVGDIWSWIPDLGVLILLKGLIARLQVEAVTLL